MKKLYLSVIIPLISHISLLHSKDYTHISKLKDDSLIKFICTRIKPAYFRGNIEVNCDNIEDFVIFYHRNNYPCEQEPRDSYDYHRFLALMRTIGQICPHASSEIIKEEYNAIKMLANAPYVEKTKENTTSESE